MQHHTARSVGTRPDWWAWVSPRLVARYGRENIARLAQDTGISRSVITDWRNKGTPPLPHSVAAVANALGANRVDAYIAAGHFTEADLAAFCAAPTDAR